MESLRPKLTRKMSLPALISGVVVTLAGLFFTMSFAAAIGLWSFRIDDLMSVGWPFWFAAIFGWAASSAFGSVVAVLGSQAEDTVAVLLHALVSWAGAYLVFGGLAVNISDILAQTLVPISSSTLLWAGFIGDMFSLLASLACGYAVSDPRAFKLKARRESSASASAPAPQAYVPVGQFT